MLTPDLAAAIAALLAAVTAFASLGVTIWGWRVTASMQEKLATMQGEVQKTVSEHDTRYAYLHQRRVLVIDQIYKKIDKVQRLFSSSARTVRFKMDASPETQRAEAMKTFWGELYNYYFENRLYLDEDLCRQIDDLFSAVFQIDSSLGAASNLAVMQGGIPDPIIQKQIGTNYLLAEKRITTDLPNIRDQIEKKMRTILGVDHDTSRDKGLDSPTPPHS